MDGTRHRRDAKAGGNSYSPILRPPRPSSTLQFRPRSSGTSFLHGLTQRDHDLAPDVALALEAHLDFEVAARSTNGRAGGACGNARRPEVQDVRPSAPALEGEAQRLAV